MKTGRLMFAITLVIGLSFIASCSRNDGLPVENARERIANHFEREKYNGIVELKDISFVDNRLDNFHGSQYMDMLFEVTIEVKKEYVMSRLFMLHSGFDVNHNWPHVRQQRIDRATDEESRRQIIDFYDERAFPAGTYTIKSLVTYGKLSEDQWLFIELSMDSSAEHKDPLVGE